MKLTPSATVRLAEMAKRRPAIDRCEDEIALSAEVAEVLRERFLEHPKQRAYWQSTASRSAALCTRRAGKSDGGVREWLATAVTTAGWRGVYVNETKGEARKIVWKNDMGQGWLDLLATHGTVEGDGYRIGGVTATTNETTLEINFSNGAQIALFGADDESSINRMRGQAKDDVWVDEAQKFRHLRAFLLQVASACVKDKRGRIRLTGSPSEDCAGYFYDVTPEPETGDVPLQGWEVHRWSVIDNPWFGKTSDERWSRTAGEALTENGWDGTEPEFLREWLGKWVKSDARYVYPVHAVPSTIKLTYAPQRLMPNTINVAHPDWYDHDRAFADLPRPARGHKPYTWLYAIGADFGYAQDPFAIAVWAYTHAPERPEVFEMFSWKEHKVLPDDQRDYLQWLWRVLDNVVVLVGDPAGQVAANMAGWRERVNLPIDEADKSSKPTWQAMMAGDIRKGRVRYRENSPLLVEHKHLVYLPTKPGKPLKDHADRRTSDGKVHGNHCFVAGTLVSTAYGDRPIEQVEVGDRVWTRAGLRRVTTAQPTRVSATWELSTVDGRRLRGTGDHQIATPDGWIQLASLTPRDMVIGWGSTAELIPSCSMGDGIGDIPSQSIEHHEFITRASSSATDAEPLSSCIGSSGSTPTGPSRMGITSTTPTRTHLTTRSPTSCVSAEQLTGESMPQHLNELLHRGQPLTSSAIAPRHGTGQPTDWHGTHSMDATSWPLGPSSRRSASSAAATSRRSSQTQNPAALHADQPSVGTAGSMTSGAHARCAPNSSRPTGTAESPAVPVRVAAARPTGLVEQVYELSVEDEHEFVANGIVVSNCSDAGLYAFRHLTHFMNTAAVEKPVPGSEAAMSAQAEFEERCLDSAEQRRAKQLADGDEMATEYGWGGDGW